MNPFIDSDVRPIDLILMMVMVISPLYGVVKKMVNVTRFLSHMRETTKAHDSADRLLLLRLHGAKIEALKFLATSVLAFACLASVSIWFPQGGTSINFPLSIIILLTTFGLSCLCATFYILKYSERIVARRIKNLEFING